MAKSSFPYWFSVYFGLSLGSSEEELRGAVRAATRDFQTLHLQFPLHDVYLCIEETDPARLRDVSGWVRVARACAAEGLHFWLSLSRVGWEGGSLPEEALAAVLADESGQRLLGLFMHEPSLPLTPHFPDQVFWFDATHFHIPANPCSVNTSGLDQWAAAELSFRPENGAGEDKSGRNKVTKENRALSFDPFMSRLVICRRERTTLTANRYLGFRLQGEPVWPAIDLYLPP